MFIQTLVLSILQSITEFLPVSSSGHLLLVPMVFGWKSQGIALDIGMHIGTLFAVCLYFAGDLWRMTVDLFKGGSARKQVFLLSIATLPILLVGYFGGRYIVYALRNPYIACFMLVVFGIFLWLADKYMPVRKTTQQMSVKDALFIGVAQCLSLIPGTSRSGVTMTAARLSGLNRTEAARFSMLLSIPAIGAAGGWLILKLFFQNRLSVLNAAFFEGIVFSFLGGLLVIRFLMQFVKKHSFFAFMVYRVVLAIFLLAFLLNS